MALYRHNHIIAGPVRNGLAAWRKLLLAKAIMQNSNNKLLRAKMFELSVVHLDPDGVKG